MAKQDNIIAEGTVMEALGNSNFRVTLDMGSDVLCTISGKMRKFFIRIIAGDRVKIEMSPYDLTRGRIVERINNNRSINSGGDKKK